MCDPVLASDDAYFQDAAHFPRNLTPGDRGQVVKHGDLTVRVSGLYRGAKKDRMLLKVSFDEGGQAAVKEFMLGLDETAIVHYPLAKGGEVVVLLVST